MSAKAIALAAISFSLVACAVGQPVHRDLATTRGFVASIDSLVTHRKIRTVLAVRLVKPDSIVRIPDEDHLPDDVLAAYTLSYDPQGHLVMFRDVPTSASGDWYLSTVHYFDANGKTLVCFVRYATTTSGCTSVLRLRRFIYMDESGRVLRDTVSWSDAWHAPFIPDPARCRAQVPELPPISGVLEIPAQLRAFTPDEH